RRPRAELPGRGDRGLFAAAPRPDTRGVQAGRRGEERRAYSGPPACRRDAHRGAPAGRPDRPARGLPARSRRDGAARRSARGDQVRFAGRPVRPRELDGHRGSGRSGPQRRDADGAPAGGWTMSADTAAPAPARPPRRGAYLLPSLFTIGNIYLGFLAIVLALGGRFTRAGFCIVLAAVLDFLDGKIARMTHTESEFGREFDSLADVLTFGMAPALCAWAWGLHELGRAGWLVPLFYVVATATRLARFNVQTTRVDSRWFVGLPSPAAAGTIASFLLVG